MKLLLIAPNQRIPDNTQAVIDIFVIGQYRMTDIGR